MKEIKFDSILGRNWVFLVSRPYDLFGASLYQAWFDSPQITELLGASILNNLYVEEHPSMVRRYVIDEEQEKFKEKIREIIITDKKKCEKILSDGQKSIRDIRHMLLSSAKR